jgi:Undecaprenyl-phosphate galactose phosphotransferase WbaP
MGTASVLTAAGEERRTYAPLAEQAAGMAFLVADTSALVVAYAITITIRGVLAGAPLWPHYFGLLPFLGVVPLLIWMMDLYPGVLLNPVEEFRRLTLAITLGMSLVVVATFLVKEANAYSRVVFVAAAPLGVALVLCGRWLVRRTCCDARWWGIPAILIGPADEVDRIRRVMETQPDLGIRAAAVVYADRTTLPLRAEEHVAGGAIPYALVVIPHGADRDWVRSVERLVWGCNKIIVVPQSMGLLWSWMRTRDCGGVVGLEVRRELLRRRARLTKRAMDYTLALGGGALILPWIAIIAALVKLGSRGPAFYGHPRIGEGGRIFRAWKFRTMVENADGILEQCLGADPELQAEWDAQHKLKNDPRVTKIGKFLRQTSLDELPQIWNVLRGEMSLVGPRPIVHHEVEKYAEEFDLYLKVRPGITGLWQVSGRSETTYDERVGMDGHYVRNWSVWLDVYLLAKTVGVVLRKQGAY